MTEQELNERKLVMLRLLNIFSGMDGGIDFITLRTFVEEAEGEAITKILKHMSLLLDAANVATEYTVEDLPRRIG
ncbi:hypothetical protein BN79_073 [Yersinia phage phiR2-01]|uniref:G060 protein n=1 Tax=Yersinia phage phiR2-01 TaxID=1206557 RepID=I7J3T6_9CAUD|nr:hypothetical protein BN79_073 [Yersinia phage phiR2-01]CCI88488.1 g060 [Yersinia phage phiR2-01]